jgi:YD repeat-containing protein
MAAAPPSPCLLKRRRCRRRRIERLNRSYSAGLLSGITTPIRRSITIGRNSNNFISVVSRPIGRTWQYFYDGNGLLKTANANWKGAEYGQFVAGVDVTTGQLNQLSYTMYLPQISERDKVRIASPLAHDTVIANPDIPGLEVRLPAGTVVRDRKGRIVTELALVPTPVDRAPVPLPANLPVFATLEPGKTADFLQYTPDEGWRVYGKGQVTADGSQIAREMGVEAHGTITFGANTRVIFWWKSTIDWPGFDDSFRNFAASFRRTENRFSRPGAKARESTCRFADLERRSEHSTCDFGDSTCRFVKTT